MPAPDFFVFLTGRAFTYLLTHLLIITLVKINYKLKITNALLHIFFTENFAKWPTKNYLFLRNSGGLSLDRIYFRGCHWSLQFTNYSCTLIGENNVLISKEREKEWIKN